MKTTIKAIFSTTALLGLMACGGSEPVEQSTASAPASAGSSSSPMITCDRACLNSFVDQYVAALVANDHTLAPFSADAKFTENAQVLKLGDALWGTASGIQPDAYKLVVADPQTNTAGFWIIMEEAGEPLWLTGRLTVANQQITELETVLIRSGGGFSGFDHDTPDPMWMTAVSPEESNTREELFDAADRYIESLEQNLVDHVAFDESCNRLENGVMTANNPDSTDMGGDGTGIGSMSCQDNINSGMWVYIQDINISTSAAVRKID